MIMQESIFPEIGPIDASKYQARNGSSIAFIMLKPGYEGDFPYVVVYDDSEYNTVTALGRCSQTEENRWDVVPRVIEQPITPEQHDRLLAIDKRLDALESRLAELLGQAEKESEAKALPMRIAGASDPERMAIANIFDDSGEAGLVQIAEAQSISEELTHRSLVIGSDYRVELREHKGRTHILFWPKES